MTEYTCLLDLVTVAESIGALFSLVTSCVLLTLLCSLKHARLATYKYLMICCCFIQMLYSITSFTSHMRAHSTTISYVLFREYKGPNRIWAPFLLLQFCWMYTSNIVILCVQFLYRYIHLWKDGKIHWFEKSKLVQWISFAILFGFTIIILKYSYLGENHYLTKHLSEEFAEFYDFKMDEIIYNGPIYYKDPDEEKPLEVWLTIGALIVGMSLCYTSMMVLGFMSYLKLKDHKSILSVKTRDLQKQLLVSLVIQATIPSLLIFILSELLFITPVFGIGLGPYANIPIAFLTIYPPLDQMGVIYIIKDFRTALKTFFKKGLSGSISSSWNSFF